MYMSIIIRSYPFIFQKNHLFYFIYFYFYLEVELYVTPNVQNILKFPFKYITLENNTLSLMRCSIVDKIIYRVCV